MMSFSAQTSANQTQDILDGKFEKRRQGRDKDTGLDYTMWGPMLGKPDARHRTPALALTLTLALILTLTLTLTPNPNPNPNPAP